MTLVVVLLFAVIALALVGYGSWRLGVLERDALTDRTTRESYPIRSERITERIDRRLWTLRAGRWLGRRLERSGLGWRLVDAWAALAAIGLGASAVAWPFVSWWAAIGVGVGAGRLALIYLDRLEERRREAFIAQLPEVARVLSNATSAGLALRTAIRLAADDLAAPAGPELAHLVEQLDVGTPITDALEDMYHRLPSRELSLLTRTLIIQARAGGAVVTALREMSETLEARKDLRREVRTVLAGPVYTSWLVLALGVGAVLLLNVVAPRTLNQLTSSFWGQATLVVSGLVYAVGFVLIRRLTRIEV